MRRFAIAFLLAISLSIVFQMVSVKAIDVDPSVVIDIYGGVNVTFYSNMTFDVIDYTDQIILNTTTFQFDTVNNLNVTMVYLDSDPLNATENENIIIFNAATIAGTVQVNISGLDIGSTYYVYRDAVHVASPVANATGWITFSSSSWSSHQFIVKLNNIADAIPGIIGTTNYLTQTVLPILIAVVIIGFIIGLIGTVGFTKETMITILIVVIIGVITIQVLIGL